MENLFRFSTEFPSLSPSSPLIEWYARLASASGPVFARRDGHGFRVLSGAPWAGAHETGATVDARATRLLVPVQPSKIVCVGRNYAAHAAEMAAGVPEEPILFLKPPSSLVATGDPIVIPTGVGRVDHEVEMGLVIGRHLHRASLDQARHGIFGVTCVNDVSARALQKKDGQWTRAKAFDTFCPLGPGIARGLDPDALSLRASVNGAERQRGHTRDLLVKSAELVAFVSRVMTLEPGDVISTGTPEGVGPLEPGDVVSLELEGVGTLENPVRAEDGS